MKIVMVDIDYRDYDTVVSVASEPIEVTEEEYNLIKNYFTVRIVMDKEYLLTESERMKKEQEERNAKWRAEEEKRKAKAATTAEKRKMKQLEKLKKEFGIENLYC
jgi:transposase